jgi:hypothetical protein
MNTEIERTSFDADGHPDENQLLLALEGELPSAEAMQIEQHLGTCWSCRARSHEMQRGILAFVEYREKRYLPSIDTPPDDFRGFPAALRSTIAESEPIGLSTRIWQWIRSALRFASQVKWAGAMAAIMAAVIFWTQVLFSPATLSATELLTRAAAAQNPILPREKQGLHRTAHQRLRISSAQQTVVREFSWTIGSPIPQVQWEMQKDPAKWSAPLTADGFSAWRNALGVKKDRVRRSGEQWVLDTAAAHDDIKEAWIVLRATDFRPVEQHIRFADDRQLDFEELSFEIGSPRETRREPTISAQTAPHVSARPLKSTSVPDVNLSEREVDVRYTMFTHRWDLDEDLLITQTPSAVAVSGVASSTDRAISMRAILSGLPNVQIMIKEPGATGQPAGASPSQSKSTAASSAPLLKDVLDQAFPSHEQRLAFVDRCLAASDAELSHAWAVKKLVDRYTEAEERRLTAGAQSKLTEMVRVHLQKVGEENVRLDPLIELLPRSHSRKTEVPADWRTFALALFAQVQRQDSLVASLIAGTRSNGQDARAASESFRSAHETVAALLNDLKTPGGTRQAK